MEQGFKTLAYAVKHKDFETIPKKYRKVQSETKKANM